MTDLLSPVGMFNWRRAQAPDDPFLFEPSGESFTYEETGGLAGALSADLDRSGLGSGEVIAVYSANRPHWVVASLAAWSGGLVVAAIDRLMPPDSARQLIALCGAKLVCVGPDERERHDLGVPIVPVPTRVSAGRVGPALADPGLAPDAAILFTSGTTGQPKGFTSSHHRLADGARRQAESYASAPAFRPSVAPAGVAPIVSFTAYGHLAAYTSLTFALWTGRRLALVEKFRVEAVRALVERENVDVLRLNPAAIFMLATAEPPIDLSRLRYVYSGTAPLPGKTREMFTSRYGVPILQGYGQSETGPIALSRYEDVVQGTEPPGSVGRVLASVTLRIADPDGRPCPNGSEGEIQVRTAAAADPVDGDTLPVTVDGYIRTGDIGKVDDDGFLWVTGRLTEKMVVGGFNVFPSEIEEVLRRSPLVLDVVVVGLPDDRLGERPVAGVVWEDTPDRSGLERYARQSLAAYKVPRAWFDLSHVPSTDRGKVDRNKALAIAQSEIGSS